MLAKTTKIIKKIAFFGDADAKSFQFHFKGAYNTARLLAKNGFVIVNGGGPGIMLASTLGAKKENGRVELVIINKRNEPGNYEGTNKRNASLADKIYYENNYHDRLDKLIKIADAFVIFKGGTGTISEIGLSWEMAKFEHGDHEPLIFYGKFWKNILNQLKKGLPLTQNETSAYGIAKNPEEVLNLIKNATK